MEEAYAMYVKWRDTDCRTTGRQFIIMWSDNTWETVCCPLTKYYMPDGKTFKQAMALNKIVSSRMTKSEAKAYIEERVAKYM